MRTLHLRYLVKATLIEELLGLFPDWDGVTRDITGMDIHAYFKTEYDPETGLPTSYDVYLLIPEESDYTPPLTGTLLAGQATHYFMGHDGLL